MIAVVLALCLLAPADPASRAEAHFAAGEYEQAIEALHEAYAIEPDPAFVFAEGSALQELGRHAEAIQAYERFLALAPPKEQAQKAFDRIQVCRAALGEAGSDSPPLDREPEPSPASHAAPPPVLAREPAPRVPDDVPPVPRPWHRDVTGGVLLGVGIAVAATGGALVGVGAARHRQADGASTEGSFRTDLRGSVAMQGVGIGLAVTGGALLVGAIVRYAIVRRRSRSANASHTPNAGALLGRWLQPQPSSPG